VNEDLNPPGPLTAGGLRVTSLGGISEIGRNMTVFEHLGRLLVIDCGVMFPTHDEPGVDLILPDLRHIEDRLDDIVRQKIQSLSRRVAPGSREWDVLYRKYYEEELRKHR